MKSVLLRQGGFCCRIGNFVGIFYSAAKSARMRIRAKRKYVISDRTRRKRFASETLCSFLRLFKKSLIGEKGSL